ncbi:MAG: hypothetical protein KME03_00330 [Aphanocapsa lilacina HA4352-LM1]|jgi:hypothetical protein|nr:hypothetical protein [Aphanocapsa lilacina HA4352-LM1]
MFKILPPALACAAILSCAIETRTVLAQPTATEEAVATRNGPFSQMFTVGPAYLVKDKDFNPSQPKLRFSSLWVDIPTQNVLEVAVRYCVEERDIANEQATLTEMILLDANQPRVRITQVLAAKRARQVEVSPPRYIPPAVVGPVGFGPYGGFWGGYIADPGTYFPEVDCSTGSTRFDLTPVKMAIAQLPNRTLQVQLLYNTGSVQNWQLGGGTVQALKQLPDLAKLVSGSGG